MDTTRLRCRLGWGRSQARRQKSSPSGSRPAPRSRYAGRHAREPRGSESGEPVVDGSLRTPGECDQLRRGQHPVGVQQDEQLVVDGRQTIGHATTTAAPAARGGMRNSTSRIIPTVADTYTCRI